MGYAWGVDRSALKAIYCGLIRSILDYGAGTSLRKLDIIQYQALRLCTVAFKTNPDHPTKCTLEPCWEKGKRDSKSFGWTITQETEEIEIAHLDVSQTVPLSIVPPWVLPNVTVDFTLLMQKSKEGEFGYNVQKVQAYIDRYHFYV